MATRCRWSCWVSEVGITSLRFRYEISVLIYFHCKQQLTMLWLCSYAAEKPGWFIGLIHHSQCPHMYMLLLQVNNLICLLATVWILFHPFAFEFMSVPPEFCVCIFVLCCLHLWIVVLLPTQSEYYSLCMMKWVYGISQVFSPLFLTRDLYNPTALLYCGSGSAFFQCRVSNKVDSCTASKNVEPLIIMESIRP